VALSCYFSMQVDAVLLLGNAIHIVKMMTAAHSTFRNCWTNFR